MSTNRTNNNNNDNDAGQQPKKKRRASASAPAIGEKMSKLLLAQRDRVYVQANEVVRAASSRKRKKRPLELQLIDALKRGVALQGDTLEQCPFLSELVILAKYCEDAMIVNDLALKQIGEWQHIAAEAEKAVQAARASASASETAVIGNGFGFTCVATPIDRPAV